MPEDLRQKIIEAIAANGDDNFKKLALLLLRVEEVFLDEVKNLTEQMTVPGVQHAKDHAWVKAARDAGRDVRFTTGRMVIYVLERGAWVAATTLAIKLFGGHL